MTFKISPGVYVLSSDIEQVDYSGSPIALVGSFRKGSLTPTRIRYGENSDNYDLSSTNSKYGYSTEVARHVAATNNLVIKRVVSKTARTATKSLLKNSEVSMYAQMHYDAAGNLLEPVAIFFNSEIIEDYKVIIRVNTTDNFTCSAEAKWSTTHNAVVESLAAQLKEQLQAHNPLYTVEYDELSEQIPAILIYPPYGYRINGSVEVVLDLIPLTDEQKNAILDEYVEAYKINPTDKTAVSFMLRNTELYKRKEVDALLKVYIEEHYLSANLVNARLNYYVAQHQIREKDISSFLSFLAGREQCLHNYEELDDFLAQFKSTFYMSHEDIITYTESLIGTVITVASVQRITDDAFIPNYWLYANTTEVLNAVTAWANSSLMSYAAKQAWVNQYIAQDRIRQNDYDDALSVIDVPTDDVIGIQNNLSMYCLQTYLSQDEKNAIIQHAIDTGIIQQSEFDNVARLTSYLIRKDQAYLVNEAINLYAASKTLTITQINAWIQEKTNTGYILQDDVADFKTFLVNDPVVVYVYHNYDELEAKYQEYAAAKYITAAQGRAFVMQFVGTTIASADANEIIATITAQVCRQSVLQSQVNQYAAKYMSEAQIQSYIEHAFNVLPEDVPTLVALFDGELINDTSVIDSRVHQWLDNNYMNQTDYRNFALQYDDTQSSNTVVILNQDIAAFADWASVQTTSVKKTDTLGAYSRLTEWTSSYYVSQSDLVASYQLIAGSRGYVTDTYNAWVASTYCTHELYAAIESAESDMTRYLDAQIQAQVIQYVNANYSGNALYQVMSGIITVSDGTAVDTGDGISLGGEDVLEPFVVDSYSDDVPVYKTFNTYNEAIALLEKVGSTYLSWTQFNNVLQANLKYNRCTVAEKERIFSYAWYQKEPDDPKLEAYPNMMYTSSTDLTNVLNALADMIHTLQVEYYCFRFIDSATTPRYLYTKTLALSTTLALYGHKGSSDSDIMSIPVSAASGMQLLGTGKVDGASSTLYTIASVDDANKTITLEDADSNSYTASRVPANDAYEDW